MPERIEPGSAYDILARRCESLLNANGQAMIDRLKAIREAAELRAKLAKRSADVQSKVRYMQDTYPYTAPENMLSLFTAFANQINDLVQQWEDEDAAAAQVPGDSQGPAPKVAD